jgi:uncharacterized protein with predicted RNA binding PUA domain
MSTGYLQSNFERVRTLADFQFFKGAGMCLFPDACTFIYSRRGGVRQVLLDNHRLATLRAHDGRLTLGLAGCKRLYEVTAAPPFQGTEFRVMVQQDVASFIADGKNVFAKHVVFCDSSLLAGDEVIVVDEAGALLGVGMAHICGNEMRAFMYGAAVQMRRGVNQEDIS